MSIDVIISAIKTQVQDPQLFIRIQFLRKGFFVDHFLKTQFPNHALDLEIITAIKFSEHLGEKLGRRLGDISKNHNTIYIFAIDGFPSTRGS